MKNIAIVIENKNDKETIDYMESILFEFNILHEVYFADEYSVEDIVGLSNDIQDKDFSVLIICYNSILLPNIMSSVLAIPVLGVHVQNNDSNSSFDVISLIKCLPDKMPFGYMSCGKSGIKNAILFAVSILAISDLSLNRVLKKFKGKQLKEIQEKPSVLDQKINKDSLYDDAVKLISGGSQVSISYIQRQLNIGFNRAAKIIEHMEKDKIVSKPDHKGKRSVLLNFVN